MDPDLVNSLALKTIDFLKGHHSCDMEKACWMVIHEHHHGLMPFEYDIREIDETLYLSVLAKIKEKIG